MIDNEAMVNSEASPTAEADARVARTLEDVHDAVEALRTEFRSNQQAIADRDHMLDRLHDQNERLRAGERQLVLRPVQVDLQRLRNDLRRQAATLPERFGAADAIALLESFADEVEVILQRCGVRVLAPERGAPFEPTQHRAVGNVDASSVELDATVAELVTDGYVDSATERVIAPASVRVARWQAPTPRPSAE